MRSGTSPQCVVRHVHHTPPAQRMVGTWSRKQCVSTNNRATAIGSVGGGNRDGEPLPCSALAVALVAHLFGQAGEFFDAHGTRSRRCFSRRCFSRLAMAVTMSTTSSSGRGGRHRGC